MLAPVLALAMLQGPPSQAPPPMTGDFLYSACKVYIEMTDHETLTGKPFSGGFCMGFLLGISDALGADKIACPTDAKIETIARVYLAYMDKNPKLRDATAEEGLVAAIRDGYPCPSK